MIPLCASHIPFCANMMSRETLVVVLRWLHIRSNCPFLVVVLERDFFPFPGMHAYQAKRHAEGTLLEGLSAQSSIYD